MIEFLIILAVAALIVISVGYLSGGNPLFFLKPLFGYKKIFLYDGEYSFNPDFTTYAKFDADGNVISPVYFYNLTNIGLVKINKDGTAEHCGNYKWRFV